MFLGNVQLQPTLQAYDFRQNRCVIVCCWEGAFYRKTTSAGSISISCECLMVIQSGAGYEKAENQSHVF